ncbi:sugar phosphate nucleotidyltransferase [Pontimonas sp.]|nr:sugar phosphate nucleotidyltransferase [Pontimonas sp.]MDA8900963.1 sugar phosphate nucleotidyltransferase [Pontimonas sp.]
MEVIDKTGLGSVFVLGAEDRLVAVVTDGDVRRALLAGNGLESPAHSAFNSEFLALVDGSDSGPVFREARRAGFTFIPVVDQQKHLVSVEVMSASEKKVVRENPVVVMAGGKGSRLGSLTRHTPKPLIMINGKPMLEAIVEKVRDDGFSTIYLAIHYLGDQIEEHFGDGSRFGVNVMYLREASPLGTAGALSLLPKDSDMPVVVLNGDLILGASIAKMVDHHLENGADLTVGGKVFETTIPYGVLSVTGDVVTEIVEKPTYRDLVNAGVYVMSRAVVAGIVPDRVTEMPEIVSASIAAGKARVYAIHEEWADLGSPAALKTFQRETL